MRIHSLGNAHESQNRLFVFKKVKSEILIKRSSPSELWISNDINSKCSRQPFRAASVDPRRPIFSMTKNATSVRISVGRCLACHCQPCLHTIPSSYGSMELTSRARSSRISSTPHTSPTTTGPVHA